MCTYLNRGRYNSGFYKILLKVICQLLLHGIAQNFTWHVRTARDDIDIISVVLPHKRVLQLRFFENSSHSHNLAPIAWNSTKLNIRYTYQVYGTTFTQFVYKQLIRGAVMPLCIHFHQTEYMRYIILELMYYIYIEKSFAMATTYQF